MDLSQNVELTWRKWFSDNSRVQATTLSRCCSNSLWNPNTHTYSSRMAGETKAEVSCLPPTPRAACTCWRGTHWLLSGHHSMNSQKQADLGPSLCTNRRRGPWLTGDVMSGRGTEVAFSRCIPAAGGDCLCTEQCTEKGQLRWNKPSAQTTRSALRMQLGLSASPPRPLTSISFLQIRPRTGVAFRYNCSKGLWKKEAVSQKETRGRYDSWSSVTRDNVYGFCKASNNF